MEPAFVTLEEVRAAKALTLKGWSKFSAQFFLRILPIGGGVSVGLLGLIWIVTPEVFYRFYGFLIALLGTGFILFPALFFCGHLGLHFWRMRQQLEHLEVRVLAGEKVPRPALISAEADPVRKNGT